MLTLSSVPQDLVLVPVPRAHLMAVYGFIAGLDDELTEAAEDATEVTWPVQDLRRFASTQTTTSVTIGKVLDILALEPGKYLSTSQLEDQTGIARSNLKGAFSGLTRHINKHYDGRGWMLTFKWGPELGPGYPAEGHYTLSEDQAKRWNAARADA